MEFLFRVQNQARGTMSEQSKLVTRQGLYEAVWAKPISTLVAKKWNTNYAQIVKACALMDVPRPGSGHWQVHRAPAPDNSGAPDRQL
jgi:hypothetical protein